MGQDGASALSGLPFAALAGSESSTMQIEDLWYKNAIIYCLDVEKYMDADGDGCGDFEGLRRRLDYLAGLGVTCVWLQPFYPSPNRDNGGRASGTGASPGRPAPCARASTTTRTATGR